MNRFGIVKTDDNTIYRIQDPNKKLLANVPTKVRFYIKYDTSQPPPKLVEIWLNAKTVCPEKGATMEAPASTHILFTSPQLTIPLSTQTPSSDNFYGNNGRPSSSKQDDLLLGNFPWSRQTTPQSLEEECGVVIKPAQPLITYGEPTKEGEFPWHAALYRVKGINLTYLCGASLITRYHLITVAHCVTNMKTQNTVSPTSLLVYLGKYYLTQWDNPGIQDRQIEKIIVHQNYNSHTFKHDIAILKLFEPANITIYVRPVCLWKDNKHLESVIRRQSTVVGWGFDETGRVTNQLTKAHMPVVAQETCIYSLPQFYSRFTSDHTYCAGYENGTSTCSGDSGGGMVFPQAGSDPNNPVWAIRGMVSISVASQSPVPCDSSHYAVFTDTAKYLDWIDNALNL
ncbi:chymotrypsin-like protease CTRL-1 isoform X2 [Diabrotica undecimpunctata]|uniref:chymotrypsin-like protease CTRL-1 isoform X2 n=1 Tax=Diabrotica undecimpunctata TaxID=50387 RepID=UPI003B6347FD